MAPIVPRTGSLAILILNNLLMNTRMLLLAVLSGICIQSFAALYYVSPTINDANTGFEASPFKTIPKAVSVAVAGNIISTGRNTFVQFA